jgi:hypothetical protein
MTNSCLSTGACYESRHGELMNAVFPEPQVQIRVSRATGTRISQGYDSARLRFELAGISPPRVGR